MADKKTTSARECRALARAHHRHHPASLAGDTPSTALPGGDDDIVVGDDHTTTPTEQVAPTEQVVDSVPVSDGTQSTPVRSRSEGGGAHDVSRGVHTAPGSTAQVDGDQNAVTRGANVQGGRDVATSGYGSSFDTARDGEDPSSPWRMPRWEQRRSRCRDALPVPPMDTFPPSGFSPTASQHGRRKRLPPGVIRNRVGTWVTNNNGFTAFYARRAIEVGSMDMNSDGEYPSPFPTHASFASTLDEDDYSIYSRPCTGSFSFTQHPDDYEHIGSGGSADDEDCVPVSSVSLPRPSATHAQEVSESWVSDPDIPVPPRCAALISMATSVDDAMDHIADIYDRQNHLHDRLVDVRKAVSTHNDKLAATLASVRDLSVTAAPARSDDEVDTIIHRTVTDHLTPFHSSLTDMESRLSEFMTTISAAVDALDSRLTQYQHIIDQEFVAMDSRFTTLDSRFTNLSTPSGTDRSKRASLSAFEKSAKQRLTDHAMKLANGLNKKRVTIGLHPDKGVQTADRHPDASSSPTGHADDNRIRPGHGAGASGVDGWSVASDSQFSQDAPADHEGISSLPRPLRGGGTSSMDGTHRPSSSPDATLPANGSTYVPPAVTTTPSRLPTPWANTATLLAPGGTGSGQHDTPPERLLMHGCTYTRAEHVQQDDIQPQRDAYYRGTQPPAISASALSVPPLGKVWHGGGTAGCFMSGVDVLSHNDVLALGVPSNFVYAVVATHFQMSSIWTRRQGYGDRSSYGEGPLSGRSPSHLQSDALKYSGWAELPLTRVTPEQWVEFYTSLQLTAAQYGIGLMPFDALDLQYATGGHAFCICGLGYRVFSQMGLSLFLIVQKLLPLTDPQVSSKVQSVAQNGGNGFELLWLLTKHFVPMVSITRQLLWPVWPESDDVFLFARRVGLYCTLSRMRGQTPLTEAQRSDMYLSNVQGVHREHAQHLLTSLRVSMASTGNDELSPHLKLHLNDLAERLVDHLNDGPRDMGALALSARRVRESSFPQIGPSPPAPHNHGLLPPASHIQGYCVNVARVGTSVKRAPPVPKTTAARRGSSRTRRSSFDGTCDACGKRGHQAVTCDALGMAVYLRKYSADKTNQARMLEAEQNWVEKNKKWISADASPQQIMTRYCAASSVSVDQLDAELDWDLLYSVDDTEPISSAETVDDAVCNRTASAAVDWFNTHTSTDSQPSPGWYPQTFRVGISPAIPPGSLFDQVLDSPLSDYAGEIAIYPGCHHLTNPSTPDEKDIGAGTLVTDMDDTILPGLLSTSPPPSWNFAEQLLVAHTDDPRVISSSSFRCVSSTTLHLADTGSNVCLTNDLTILMNVRDIAPRSLDVAVTSSTPPVDQPQCTKIGTIPFTLSDGTVHHQDFLYNSAATETIISPEHITKSSPLISTWIQGSKNDGSGDGFLLFYGLDTSTVVLSLPLIRRNGLYYSTPLSTSPPVDATQSLGDHKVNKISRPVTDVEQLTSELWAARLGYCGLHQLSLIPSHSIGTPPRFHCHPFRFLDVKEDAKIQRQPRGRVEDDVPQNGTQFHMDFGFMRASSATYGCPPPNHPTDKVVHSFDGFNAYLIIIDKKSKCGWIFLRKSKDPPVELLALFLRKFGLPTGGVIRCDQGGELARSAAFREMALSHLYVVEPTGADSPSQNGGAERYNGSMAITVRALLYGAGLPPQYWSAALLHAMYLHNRRVHVTTRMTPYESWFGVKPDLSRLRVFGSRVSVKRSGERGAKLDRHVFHGIFIGYSATDSNIRYIDVESGVVKTCHHAVFDEAWYTQPQRPPTAQHLYSLGLTSSSPPGDPVASSLDAGSTPTPAIDEGETFLPASSRVNGDAKVVHDFDLTYKDLQQVYFSPAPYDVAFEEQMDKKYLLPSNLSLHPHGGLVMTAVDDRMILMNIRDSTPFAQLPRWRSRIRGAWLIQIDDVLINTASDIERALATTRAKPGTKCVLLFSHSAVRSGLTNDGIPQITMDQLNPHHRRGLRLPQDMLPTPHMDPQYRIVHDTDAASLVSNATRLTRGRLMKQIDWDEWSSAEKLQWDQYEAQGMLGVPCPLPPGVRWFNIVWQYDIKSDGRKKARATCDGSTRGNAVRVLDHDTYAGTPDHVGQRIFVATCAGENFIIYGGDASNAFAEAGPPRQGINLKIDRSFREWWVSKGRPPIPDNWVVPLLSAMQGHPESPRLWERHIDKILRSIGLIPTTHEPCLYSGVINGHRVLLLRQVDDFAIGAATADTCERVLDLIDNKLKIPLKRLGLLSMYNGVNIHQTRDYIKISCESYIDKICAKHLESWMRIFHMPTIGPTPLPTTSGFMKTFLSAEGDPANQKDLESRMKLSYRSGVGELIYALVTCRPDISHAVVRCAQNCITPHEIHFHAVKHILKYLYLTKSDGLYFWRERPNDLLPAMDPPMLSSTAHDLLMDGRPDHPSTSLHGYVDSDWATCPKTRRSMTGICVRFAGGTIAYKTKLQATVAQSSTEAEFMGASDFGKMMLYIRSILWDLGLPQESASFLYEDNDACTAMAMAQKPTPRTRHMDIKFHALCEWVERDLIKLERIDTTINMADHFTKALTPILFRRHTDYIMGRVPPAYSRCNPTFRLSNNGTRTNTAAIPMTPVAHRLHTTWATITQLSSY